MINEGIYWTNYLIFFIHMEQISSTAQFTKKDWEIVCTCEIRVGSIGKIVIFYNTLIKKFTGLYIFILVSLFFQKRFCSFLLKFELDIDCWVSVILFLMDLKVSKLLFKPPWTSRSRSRLFNMKHFCYS